MDSRESLIKHFKSAKDGVHGLNKNWLKRRKVQGLMDNLLAIKNSLIGVRSLCFELKPEWAHQLQLLC